MFCKICVDWFVVCCCVLVMIVFLFLLCRALHVGHSFTPHTARKFANRSKQAETGRSIVVESSTTLVLYVCVHVCVGVCESVWHVSSAVELCSVRLTFLENQS